MAELWINGMMAAVVVWAFMVLVGLVKMAWVDTALERRDAARGVLRVVAGVALVPFWPVVLPVLVVKGLMQIVRVADLNDVHARDYAPDTNV